MKTSIALLVAVLAVAAAPAAVDLEWRVENQGIHVGDTVRVGLYAVADGQTVETFCAMQVVVLWEPDYLDLQGVDDNGPYSWLSSGFPNDAGLDGLNVSFADGDAYYHAWANFGDPAQASSDGLLVTTFEFKALAASAGAALSVEDVRGQFSETAVLDDEIPGLNIVGALGSVLIEIEDGGWPTGDLNCDGLVDFGDINPFVMALSNPAGYASAFPDCDIMNGDINGDGKVDFGDVNPFIALLTGS